MNDETPITTRDSYGLLLNQDAKLHRTWFKEMVKLIGINCIFKAPKDKTKTYSRYGEHESQYEEPVVVGCIFEEHANHKTAQKLGWNAELQENTSIIHLPYDLEGLQVGALVIVPSAFDRSQGRLFRVIQMSAKMVYPASIACEIAPEYENTFSPSNLTHENDTFNLLNEGN